MFRGYSVVGIGARSFPKQGCFGTVYSIALPTLLKSVEGRQACGREGWVGRGRVARERKGGGLAVREGSCVRREPFRPEKICEEGGTHIASASGYVTAPTDPLVFSWPTPRMGSTKASHDINLAGPIQGKLGRITPPGWPNFILVNEGWDSIFSVFSMDVWKKCLQYLCYLDQQYHLLQHVCNYNVRIVSLFPSQEITRVIGNGNTCW